MRFVIVEYDSPWYRATLALRNRVLRIPLGMKLADDDLSTEATQWHFAMEHESELIACIIARPLTDTEAQLRQMAVDLEWQRQGIGARLLQAVEQQLAGRGIRQLMLHARQEAIPFYQRLGYACEGEPYVEVGIPHRTMRKSLSEGAKS